MRLHHSVKLFGVYNSARYQITKTLKQRNVFQRRLSQSALKAAAANSSGRTRLFDPQVLSNLGPSAALDDTLGSRERSGRSGRKFELAGIGYNHQKPESDLDKTPPFHLHVFTHRRNTHLTLTKPNREPLLSLSCGNIGIRKARRGLYDSAYQLTAYTLQKIQERGWLADIKELEVIFRGFGKGRDAVTKALTSSEGRLLRNRVVRVTDATRVKFGGTRSRNPRRL